MEKLDPTPLWRFTSDGFLAGRKFEGKNRELCARSGHHIAGTEVRTMDELEEIFRSQAA